MGRLRIELHAEVRSFPVQRYRRSKVWMPKPKVTRYGSKTFPREARKKKRLPTLFISRVVLSGGPVIPECLSPMVEFWEPAQPLALPAWFLAVWPVGYTIGLSAQFWVVRYPPYKPES